MSSLLSGATGLFKAITSGPTLVQFCAYPLGECIVSFEATMSDTYSTESKPTEFPIESGAVISDSIIRSPLSVSLACMVSDTPITGTVALAAEAVTVAATLALPPLGIIAAAAAYATYQAHLGAASPSQTAYAALIKLQRGDLVAVPPIPPVPFKMVSSLGVFDNMMITRLSVPRDTQMGGALMFNMDLTQVDVVQAQTIDVSLLDAPSLAAAKLSAGEQQAYGNATSKAFDAGQAAALKNVVNPTANLVGVAPIQ